MKRAHTQLVRFLVILCVMLPWVGHGQVFSDSNQDWQDRYIKEEPTALAEVSALVSRVDRILRLKLQDFTLELENIDFCEYREEERCLRNIRDTCDDDVARCRSYFFMRHEAALGAILILVRFWEGSTVIWIDDKTGRITNINSKPHFSPDRSHFAIVNTPDAYDYDGIQVWSTQGPTLQAEYGNLDSASRFYLNFIRWLDNDSFLMSAEWISIDWNLAYTNTNYASESVSATTSMIRRGGNWILERPPLTYNVPVNCPSDYPIEENSPGAFLPPTPPISQICIEDRHRLNERTGIRNCIFSPLATPCKNMESSRAR